MSNYLFTLWDGGGAVPPVLSVARGMVERGHDVRCLGDPTLREEVEAIGAAFRPWTEAPHLVDHDPANDIIKDWEARTPPGGLARSRDRLMIGPADRFARDTLAEIERERPDVLVTEMLLWGPQVAAEAAGLPCAQLCTTILPLPLPGRPPFGPGFKPSANAAGALRDRVFARMGSRLWNKALPALNRARAEQGLTPMADVMDQLALSERLIVLSPEAFDYPTPELPPPVRYTGPRLDDPAWVDEWTAPPGDDPLVLVGFTTTFMDHHGPLERIAAALGELPVRGLITTGPGLAPESVKAPANVTVVESAPHSAVLQEAAAVVTHAGHGTAMKALAAGVPMVLIPLGRDQLEIATRAVHHGTALKLKPKASPAKIAAALREVLAEPRYRAAAERMAAAIAGDLRSDRAVAELETLATDRVAATP